MAFTLTKKQRPLSHKKCKKQPCLTIFYKTGPHVLHLLRESCSYFEIQPPLISQEGRPTLASRFPGLGLLSKDPV